MRRLGVLFVVALGAACIYFSWIYFSVSSEFASDSIANDKEFDSQLWTNGTPRQRGEMVNFLLDSIGIIGKNKAVVKTLLGEPDSETHLADGEYESGFYYAVDKGDAFKYDMIVYFDSAEYARFVLFDD